MNNKLSTFVIHASFLLQGISALLVWNTFIMLDTYFKGRFADKRVGESVVFFLVLFIQIPNFIFAWVNLFLEKFRNDLVRIINLTTGLIIIGIQILTTIFYFDNYIPTNCFIIMVFVLVMILAAANSIFQNAIYGLAAMFLPASTLSIVLGSNISGCIVSVFMILTKIYSFRMFNQTMIFFTSVSFLLLINTVVFIVTSNTEEFKKFISLKNRLIDRVSYFNVYNTDSRPISEYPTRWIIKESITSITTVFLTFFTSLTIFPSIMSNIKSSDPDIKFFTEITCFLGFNLFATLGVASTLIFKVKAKTLLILSILRTVFIPLFLLCNYYPFEDERKIPVYFYSNYIYYGLVVLMSYSSGYISSLGMVYISKEGINDSKKAGLIGGVTLTSGILAGILFSGLMPYIV